MERGMLNLLPCAGCGKDKVLKEGDYCIACALDPTLLDNQYIVISPAMITHAADVSGIEGAYLKSKMEHCFERFQHYVIYKARDEWQDLVIDEKFHIPTVMSHVFKRLED